MPPRILLLQLKRIGDAVLTAPVLAALRTALPEARLTLALAGAAAGLAPLFQDADEVLTLDPGKVSLPFWTRLLTGKQDAVLDFTGSDRSALLSLASRAPVRAGYTKFAENRLRRLAWNRLCPAQVRGLHTLDFHHALLPAAGFDIPPAPDSGHLKIPENLPAPPHLPERYALVHPGTAREEKFWPPERWAALMDHLFTVHGLPLVLTGGVWEYELRHIQSIFRLTKAPVRDLSGRITLPQLAAVIARARVAVTADTAAMHLAAAFRVPQLGLFGPTNPFHWAPRHPLAAVLRAGYGENEPLIPRETGRPMADLPVEAVLERTDRLLADSATPS